MAYSAGAYAYKLAYEVAPITMTGGIAGGTIGGAISVLSLLQSISFGGLYGDGDVDLDSTFANFFPVAGSTLVDNLYSNYPFANLTVAANAVIAQPLAVSLLMRIPCRSAGDYATKTYIMQALQSTLQQHCQSGGLFNVAVPVGFYPNALLSKLHDVSGGSSLQAQIEYQWDFIKPLVTLDDALGAENAMMSNLSSGGQTDGALSGVDNAVGSPGTTSAPEVSPAATGAQGAGVSSGSVPGFSLGGA